MKNNSLKILIIVLSIVVNSCCTKEYCIGVEDINEIKFYNFSQTGLDTITILSYQKNTNFTSSIDSFTTQAKQYSFDYLSAHTKYNLNSNFDYKIKLNNTGQVFTLTNFEIKKEGCNGCFPYRPKDDFYNKLYGYQINGQRQSGFEIKIYK